ncbi:ABC transporter permease [Clostridiaceae bacterium HFYG-1003]|nr:ABC transporter permease [Clostridiaceae bacterium HFYG-1003]
MNILISILEQGLLFAISVMGIYITYKIMNFADLSMDGTYPLGGAVAGLLLMNGVNPWIATLIAAAAGALGGSITGLIHTKLKINGLMAGILVMFGLYSVNLRIMGKSNIPLFNSASVFDLPELKVAGTNLTPLLLLCSVVLVIRLGFEVFFKTRTGFFLRAVGDNEEILTSLAADSHAIKILGLALANFLVGLSGALTAQYQGFADVGMGTGSAVTALAAVIIGTALLKRLDLAMSTIAIIGAILYKAILVVVLRFGLDPNDFKLATAVAVIIAMGSSYGSFQFRHRAKKASRVKGVDESAQPQRAVTHV